MARTRVFISSTFYDLKYVRADLEVFIRELGYEPVLNERGHIPYGSSEPLEAHAYREVEMADIVVSIIGGRFGAKSSGGNSSISQEELKRAVAAEKQVYIFVERGVQVEYGTYLLNKDTDGVKYQAVDDVRVFDFLEKIEQLPRNNATASFETARDITEYLREQWAGLFQNFLQQQRVNREADNLVRLERTANTLDRLLKVASENANDMNQLANDVVLTNHPAFAEIQSLLDLPYRIFFTTRQEFGALLTSAVGFSHEVKRDAWDRDDYAEWYRDGPGDLDFDLLTVYEGIFDESGSLKPFTPEKWNAKWIEYRSTRPVASTSADEKA